MTSNLADYIGFYQGRDDSAPAYEPPGPHHRCLVCTKPILAGSIGMQVGGLVAKDGSGRVYFFRAHKACWARLNDTERSEYERSITDKPVHLPVPAQTT